MNIVNAEGVHFCLLRGRAIFLDLPRDRYIAAGTEVAVALERAIEGREPSDTERQALERLVSRGLLAVTADTGASPRATAASAPLRELDELPPARARWVAASLAFQLRAALELRYRSLAQVVAARRTRCLRHHTAHRVAVEQLSAAFAASNILVSAHERCLLKSLALFDMMHWAGHRPTLIFGVRDHPFNAHAWVQRDDCVLNDTVDRAAMYQPILVV